MTTQANSSAQLDVSAAAGITYKLAQHAAKLRYEDLPQPLVDVVKQCVMDTLGVSIGASSLSPEARILAEYVAEMGGKPESTIFGFGGKAPAGWTVFVNGSLGHMLDFDDIGESGHQTRSNRISRENRRCQWQGTDYRDCGRHGFDDPYQSGH